MNRSDQAWRAVDAAELTRELGRWLAGGAAQRVAIDGPPCAGPASLAESLIEPLHVLGRPAVHVRADSFWRDASLRLEYGHEDVESYLTWLDAAALRRETLDPFGAGRPYLVTLRDPVSNRSTREAPHEFEDGTILLVSGALLLGQGLPFDRTVHLFLPATARARRTPAEDAWTLPAFEHYDASVRPAEVADVTVRVDRRSPAVRGLRT